MAELFKVNAPVRKPLFEGVQGENEARSIQFDITPWVEELGDGAVTATAKRSQDSQPYPVTVTKDGNTVTWKPTSTDTAFAGVGSFQLEYTVDDVLAKTCIWSTMVAPSLDPAGDPPDPYDNWLAEMREIAADAIQAAQDAEDSADDAQAEVYESEAWAKGTKNGTPVSSSDAQYQNNAKYFAEESYKNAEAWAVGQRGGVDVPSTDPTYENNAKYWAEQSLANQYGAYIVKSASGNIASFTDGADDVPMKSVNVTITPKQSGSGDPSPSNVRPITGTSTANVFVTGTNIWDEEWENGYYFENSSGGLGKDTNTTTIRSKNIISVKPNTTYRFTRRPYRAFFLDADNKVISLTSALDFTTPANCYGLVFYMEGEGTYNHDISINYPSTDTAYHAYNGHTTPVPLGQTVYGGSVNPISGELVIDKAMVDLGTLTWSYTASTQIFYADVSGMEYPATATDRNKGILSSMFKPSQTISLDTNMADNSMLRYSHNIYIRNTSQTTAAGFKTFVNGQTLVYPLATPTTVQLTPAQVATLLGTNNVWADCGDIAVEYRADPTLAYAELEALILENI